MMSEIKEDFFHSTRNSTKRFQLHVMLLQNRGTFCCISSIPLSETFLDCSALGRKYYEHQQPKTVMFPLCIRKLTIRSPKKEERVRSLPRRRNKSMVLRCCYWSTRTRTIVGCRRSPTLHKESQVRRTYPTIYYVWPVVNLVVAILKPTQPQHHFPILISGDNVAYSAWRMANKNSYIPAVGIFFATV